MSDNNEQKTVYVRLSADVVDAIENHPRFCEPAPGRAGGVSAWIRQVVHRELGLPRPPDPHERLALERRGKPNPHHWSKRDSMV